MSLTNSGGKELENFGTPRQLPPNPPQPPIPEAQMQSQPEPPQGELERQVAIEVGVVHKAAREGGDETVKSTNNLLKLLAQEYSRGYNIGVIAYNKGVIREQKASYQAGLDAALAALPEDMIGAYNKDWLTGYNGGLHDARYAITKLKEPSND